MTDEIPRISYVEDEDAREKETVLHQLLALRPAPQTRPCIVVVSGARSAGRIHRLTAPVTRIGRSVGCEIVLDEEGVSRTHARIMLEPQGVVRIEDAGSQNGLVRAGVPITSVELKDGDRIDLGDAAIALLHIDDVDETVRQNLLHSATEDDETGLLVRRHFLLSLRRTISSARRFAAPTAIVVFSIDRYRNLIDEAGASEAPKALRKLGALVRSFVPREDVDVGRNGGGSDHPVATGYEPGCRPHRC